MCKSLSRFEIQGLTARDVAASRTTKTKPTDPSGAASAQRSIELHLTPETAGNQKPPKVSDSESRGRRTPSLPSRLKNIFQDRVRSQSTLLAVDSSNAAAAAAASIEPGNRSRSTEPTLDMTAMSLVVRVTNYPLSLQTHRQTGKCRRKAPDSSITSYPQERPRR